MWPINAINQTSVSSACRLYSSAVFQDFEDHARPDIQSRPVDDVVLQLKAMGKHNVAEFPFPSPPEKQQIEVAEKHLVQLGALGPDKPFKITPLGRTANLFPVSPRYALLFHITKVNIKYQGPIRHGSVSPPPYI